MVLSLRIGHFSLALLATVITSSSATRICLECWPCEIFSQPAIGLDFGPTYGRAVFRRPNGTVVEVATIQGSFEYTSAMLDIAGCYKNHAGIEDMLFPHNTAPAQQQAVMMGSATTQRVHACDGSPAELSSLWEPFKSMARQLGVQLDHALSPDPIAMLGVTYPVFFRANHQALLRRAVRDDAGLNPSLSYVQTNSAIATAAANGVRLCRCPVDAQGCAEAYVTEHEMILHIDFSGTLLSILLYEALNSEEWNDGGIAYISRLEPIDARSENRQATFWNAVIAALRIMVSKYALNHRIDYLVLSGTQADDHALHNAIQDGLVEPGNYQFCLASQMNTVASNTEGASIGLSSTEALANPVFAPAQGAAELSWRQNMRTCLDPCSGSRTLPPCTEKISENDVLMLNLAANAGLE